MYLPGLGGGGGSILPNTGDGNVSFVIAVVGLVAGVAIIATTVVRLIAKKAHKA
ncbi:MAG TPA: LPXTG cell wall anchor domain-containing protein [Ktedonobacteraceae bacterium]|nr:LPXTG cell wall anchor domain-containing protein [Ktedonobacteraceae bacterium]